MNPFSQFSPPRSRPQVLLASRAGVCLLRGGLPLTLVIGLAPGAGWCWGEVPAAWGRDKNRVSVSSHVGFNIEADFSRVGGIPATSDPGPAQGGTNHTYDDGFNLVDSNGNAGGRTWYWGYESPTQIEGGSIAMSSYSAAATGEVNGVRDDPQWGFEISYQRELGWNNSYWYGLDVGFSWLNLNISDSATTPTTATRITDRYALPVGAIPSAPYAGTFAGPGVTIGDVPTRVVENIPAAASTRGNYSVEGDMWAARLGLLFESPFTEKLTLQFGGGVAGALVNSQFAFSETTTLAGVGQLSRSGSDSDSSFIGGFYALANLNYYFTERVSGFVGAQYNYLDSFTQSAGGEEAQINFKNSIYVSIGAQYSF